MKKEFVTITTLAERFTDIDGTSYIKNIKHDVYGQDVLPLTLTYRNIIDNYEKSEDKQLYLQKLNAIDKLDKLLPRFSDELFTYNNIKCISRITEKSFDPLYIINYLDDRTFQTYDIFELLLILEIAFVNIPELPLAGLITKLAEADKNTEIKLKTVTEPTMNKTAKLESGEKILNPYLDKCVEKHTTLNATIKFDYQSEVNEQRLAENKEANFEASKRTWGEKSGCFVSHKGSLYIDTMINDSSYPRYYIDDELVVNDESLKQFLPKSSSSSAQGLEQKKIINTLKLASIREIFINGVWYKVV